MSDRWSDDVLFCLIMHENSLNTQTALYSSIGITSDEKSLFVGSATSSFVGIDSSNGVVLWSVITGSIVLTKPLVSPDDEQVYFIEVSTIASIDFNLLEGTLQDEFIDTKELSTILNIPKMTCFALCHH